MHGALWLHGFGRAASAPPFDEGAGANEQYRPDTGEGGPALARDASEHTGLLGLVSMDQRRFFAQCGQLTAQLLEATAHQQQHRPFPLFGQGWLPRDLLVGGTPFFHLVQLETGA